MKARTPRVLRGFSTVRQRRNSGHETWGGDIICSVGERWTLSLTHHSSYPSGGAASHEATVNTRGCRGKRTYSRWRRRHPVAHATGCRLRTSPGCCGKQHFETYPLWRRPHPVVCTTGCGLRTSLGVPRQADLLVFTPGGAAPARGNVQPPGGRRGKRLQLIYPWWRRPGKGLRTSPGSLRQAAIRTYPWWRRPGKGLRTSPGVPRQAAHPTAPVGAAPARGYVQPWGVPRHAAHSIYPGLRRPGKGLRTSPGVPRQAAHPTAPVGAAPARGYVQPWGVPRQAAHSIYPGWRRPSKGLRTSPVGAATSGPFDIIFQASFKRHACSLLSRRQGRPPQAGKHDALLHSGWTPVGHSFAHVAVIHFKP